MQAKKCVLAIFFTILLLFNSSLPAVATPGMPNSPEFGYGARISTSGQLVVQSMEIAPTLGFDWIAVDLDWARMWPNPDVEPDLSPLSELVDRARGEDLNVLASISNPPAWVMTETGPNPDVTTALTLRLVNIYQPALTVVELFPGANTVQGWGTIPNPDAYIGMIQEARNALSNQGLQAYVIPSFSPLSPDSTAGNIDDLTYMRRFYEAGMETPIVGLRYQEIHGQPFSEPTQSEPDVLRHYEQMRNLMLQNNHRTDLIWITGFSWPSQLTTMDEQAAWVHESYQLLKAQLYIGAAFFSFLNPPSTEDLAYNPACLVLTSGNLHPAALQLSNGTSNTGESIDTLQAIPQTPKGIIKKHIHKTISKRPSS